MIACTIDAIRNWLEMHLGYRGAPDTPEWQQIIQWHPTWANRQDLKAVRVRRSRLNKSIQMQFSTNGTRFFTVSWHACVKPCAPRTIESALREAICFQTRAWKRQQHLNQECAICHSTVQLQVDHCGVSFKDLAAQFLKTTTISQPEPNTWSFNKRTHASRLPKGMFKHNWQAFHKTHARYQFLCQSCNARKGAAA